MMLAVQSIPAPEKVQQKCHLSAVLLPVHVRQQLASQIERWHEEES